MKIVLTTTPTADDLATLSHGIKSYNLDFVPRAVVFEPDTRFAVFARDDSGAVVGGIRANAYWNYCFIELLWLSPAARGRGIGTRLMHKAEDFAAERGFEFVRTETVGFQARPFYERLGYSVFGVLQDHPKGHATFCMVKRLSPRSQERP